jgi:hypothetical protein
MRFPALRLPAFAYASQTEKGPWFRCKRSEEYYQNCQGNPGQTKAQRPRSTAIRPRRGSPHQLRAKRILTDRDLIAFFFSEMLRRSSPYKQLGTFSSLPA